MTTRAPRSTAMHSRAWLCLLCLFCLLPASRAAAQSGDEIAVEVVQYGLGNTARAGDWAGIQINILDSAPEQREVLLRLAVRDADGDRANYDRVVTANPGAEQSFWLYARLPFNAETDPPSVFVFEAVPPSDPDAPYRAGRLLGRFDPSMSGPNQILHPTVAIAGVIGPYAAGIDQYAYTVSPAVLSLPLGHELTRVVTGLDIPRMPDEWQGLACVDFLLWAECTTRATEPGALTPERARAIRTWVERGGHLVIMLPPAGDPWFAADHPLGDLLPVIDRPRRRDGFDLNLIRPLLTPSAGAVELPTNAVIHSFTPRADATPTQAQRVLTAPDGSCLAIRRVVGSGAVTVIGLDLTAGPLRRAGLPDAQSFWNRILGIRADIRRPEDIEPQLRSDAGTRSPVEFDHDISTRIDSTGRAVQGILFGLVIFISYWAIAGPLGFYYLRRRNLHQHAWVAFCACTALFTAVAWAGASILRPTRITATHLTMLEFVHGQPRPRARVWASVMLPSYGSSTVSAGVSPDAATQRSTGLLAPWEPPAAVGVWNKGFPDNTGYFIDARKPDTLTVPTRATVKQFRADLSGDSAWSAFEIQRDPALLDEPGITLSGASLSGVLFHSLPAPVTNLRVFISQGQVSIRAPGSAFGGAPIARTVVLAPTLPENAWAPGTPLDLGAITEASALRESARFDYFRSAIRDGISPTSLSPTAGRELTVRLVSARFLSQFAPPNYADDRDTVANRHARRVETHAWDLGRWLTTPALIITGTVEIDARDAAVNGSPFPITVDGVPAPSHGVTVVTWIYPLPDAPPDWSGLAQPSESQTEQPTAPTPAGSP